MTAEDRIKAIAEFGFTERQARFLVLVMRHAGVCVPRQYATFAGIANGGKKCNALFEKLVNRGLAVVCGCVHNRARLYHVHYKPLYRAIGEPDSRHRRPVPARRAVERLMLLDAVLASPDLNWLTTESEKVAHLAALTAPTTGENAPNGPLDPGSMRFAGTFAGMFPIGVDPTGRAVPLYLATVPWTDEFRTFIQAHAAFLRMVDAWTLRLVFPQPLDRVYAAYQQVVHEELETLLHTATLKELTWYFEQRKAADKTVNTQTQAFLNRAAQVFSTPRFALLYRRWEKHGDTVFEGVSSPVLADALTSGAGRIECVVLPYSYRHLSPLASLVRSSPKGVKKGEQGGEQVPPRAQPLPQLPPAAPLTVAEQSERDWYRLVGRS
jgi:hypothetical protein